MVDIVNETPITPPEQSVASHTAPEVKKKETPPPDSLATKVKEFIKSYLNNLNPKDKSWAWKVGALGSAGLSAYLAINTGGSSLLVKSVTTAAASIGFHFLEKGIYSAKENKLKREYTGDELGQKIEKMREKHKKGVDKIAAFFGGMSAGTVYGGVAGIGAEAFLQSHPGFNLSMLEENIKDSSLGHAATEQAAHLKETALQKLAQAQEAAQHSQYATQIEKVHDATMDAITKGQELVAQGKQTIENVRSDINTLEQSRETAVNLSDQLQKNPMDAPKLVGPAIATGTVATGAAVKLRADLAVVRRAHRLWNWLRGN